MRHSYVGLYGQVAIQKEFCQSCRVFAFVLDGKLACCDQASQQQPTRTKRETETEGVRRLPPLNERKAQLLEQDNRCFYCLYRFGSRVLKDKTPVILRLHWDHVVPFSYSQDNRTRNFVASCQICNAVKYNHVFQTVEEARIYVATERTRHGYL